MSSEYSGVPREFVRHDVRLIWGISSRRELEDILPDPWVIEYVEMRDCVEIATCMAPVVGGCTREDMVDILLEPILIADEAFCDKTYGAANPTLKKIKESLRKRREEGSCTE